MTKLHIVAAAVLSLVLLACGSSDPNDLIAAGHKSLSSGNSKDALDKFTKAAEGLEPSDPQFIEAKLGMVEALIPEHPAKATEEFLSLGKVFPEQVGEKEFIFMGGQMVNSKKYLEALDLVDSGIKRFGAESTKLHAMIDRIKMEAASDSGVNDKLKSMGYL